MNFNQDHERAAADRIQETRELIATINSVSPAKNVCLSGALEMQTAEDVANVLVAKDGLLDELLGE